MEIFKNTRWVCVSRWKLQGSLATATMVVMSDLACRSTERCCSALKLVDEATYVTSVALNSNASPYGHQTLRCVAQRSAVATTARRRWNSHRPIDHICFAACPHRPPHVCRKTGLNALRNTRSGGFEDRNSQSKCASQIDAKPLQIVEWLR